METAFDRQLSQSPTIVLQAVGEAADVWGADWRPGEPGGSGQLVLPTIQGLRQGVLAGTLSTAPADGGTLLQLEIEEHDFSINWSATAILTLGAIGGLTLVLWPLSPKILQLAPIGAVLAVVAWLLVVSRLRYSDAGDFLDLVAELAEHT